MSRICVEISLVLLLVLLYVPHVPAWRNFWKGRRSGGNLGDPSSIFNTELRTVPDEWFEQHLDHFDSTNHKTWRQVTFY